jgi:hypothetical protein
MVNPWDENESGVTVGKLIEQLQGFPSDYPVCLGPHGHFTCYRVKDRTGCVQIEFNEVPDLHYKLTEEHPYMQYLKQAGIL